MSKEDRKNLIRIEMNDGKELNIPKKNINKIILPGIVISNKYYRLVLEMDIYLKQIEEKIKKSYLPTK